jgi:hypothetical protein
VSRLTCRTTNYAAVEFMECVLEGIGMWISSPQKLVQMYAAGWNKNRFYSELKSHECTHKYLCNISTQNVHVWLYVTSSHSLNRCHIVENRSKPIQHGH